MAERITTCQRKVRRSLDVVEKCGEPITHGSAHCGEHWRSKPPLMGPCNECHFYNPVGEGYGQCRRHAPAPSTAIGGGGPRWPVTGPDLECGDFKDIA